MHSARLIMRDARLILHVSRLEFDAEACERKLQDADHPAGTSLLQVELSPSHEAESSSRTRRNGRRRLLDLWWSPQVMPEIHAYIYIYMYIAISHLLI